MRSTRKDRKTVEVTMEKGTGPLPPYVDLGHRHLEKEMPSGAVITTHAAGTGEITGERGTYTIPVDLIRMVIPVDAADKIESVEFHYVKRT